MFFRAIFAGHEYVTTRSYSRHLIFGKFQVFFFICLNDSLCRSPKLLVFIFLQVACLGLVIGISY